MREFMREFLRNFMREFMREFMRDFMREFMRTVATGQPSLSQPNNPNIGQRGLKLSTRALPGTPA